jgi:hypothetical protein
VEESDSSGKNSQPEVRGGYRRLQYENFFFDEGPSHHSLKAFCATPMKMMSSFFYQFFTINGAPVE